MINLSRVPKSDINVENDTNITNAFYDIISFKLLIQGGPKKSNPYVFLLIFRSNVRIFKSSFTGLKVIHTYV